MQIRQIRKDRKEVSGCQGMNVEEGGMTTDFIVDMRLLLGVRKML